MKKITLKTSFQSYPNISALPEADQKLLKLAKKSLNQSYSPYSNFKVGAALLLQNGKMVGGSNQENAAYPLCLCAERVALAAASSRYPKSAIEAIAVTAKSSHVTVDKPISPCGACRQSICETEIRHQQTMRVILQGETGDIYVLESGRDLLPLSFDGQFL
ncbi:MAG: cytidine deaminase [Bacteroidota bacterium]